jgi:hypothetical protein
MSLSEGRSVRKRSRRGVPSGHICSICVTKANPRALLTKFHGRPGKAGAYRTATGNLGPYSCQMYPPKFTNSIYCSFILSGATTRAQRHQQRHVARPSPDRIRLERLSPSRLFDSRQGIRHKPVGRPHVCDRCQQSTCILVRQPRIAVEGAYLQK